MGKLVSIIIPCFNAERWVGEAIDSCLKQSYRPIEIVVVDDGSTDNSLEIIKSFGDKIRWETGPNRGGNCARNRGFALTKGEFIQFLDADDYLLPEKISRQVKCLEESGADVVYGDWRHQHHRGDGTNWLEDIAISGKQDDVLCALLSDWWVACHALLFRRSAVGKSGGWDESLQAAQDRDFFISVVLGGAKVVYQPGCHTIYRRYGHITVGTSNLPRWLESHGKVLDKARAVLNSSNQLTPNYRHALAQSYFCQARCWFALDQAVYDQVMSRVLELEPAFRPRGSRLYIAVWRLLGFKSAERTASAKRRLLSICGMKDGNAILAKAIIPLFLLR